MEGCGWREILQEGRSPGPGLVTSDLLDACGAPQSSFLISRLRVRKKKKR